MNNLGEGFSERDQVDELAHAACFSKLLKSAAMSTRASINNSIARLVEHVVDELDVVERVVACMTLRGTR